MMEKKKTWYEELGILNFIAQEQMPYLCTAFKGTVVSKKLASGAILLVGSNDGKTNISGINYIYRFDPKKRDADLLYFNSNRNIQGELKHCLTNIITFSKYLELEWGFQELSRLMWVKPEVVKSKFPEATTRGCDQVLLNKSEGPKISISFKKKDSPPPIRCMYGYHMDTDDVELVYTNDGKGGVWAKWGETNNK